MFVLTNMGIIESGHASIRFYAAYYFSKSKDLKTKNIIKF